MDLVQDILIVVRVLLVKHNIYKVKHHVIFVHLVKEVRIQIRVRGKRNRLHVKRVNLVGFHLLR